MIFNPGKAIFRGIPGNPAPVPTSITFLLQVSRAVANTATLSEYCLPFVKIGGAFLPYKSGKIEEELKEGTKAIESMGGTVENVIHFSLIGADAERTLVKIKKISATPKKYPRKAGVPSKEPIKM